MSFLILSKLKIMKNMSHNFSKLRLSSLVFLLFLGLTLWSPFSTKILTGEDASATTEAQTWEILNINGDLSLTENEDAKFWNPHKVGLSNATIWKVSFGDHARIVLETTEDDQGHVATGMWWTSAFKTNKKIPLATSKVSKLYVDFDVKLENVSYDPSKGWLRMALACAVQRSDGSVVYTELDFWDSPYVLNNPSSNVRTGGDIIYAGGDVVEYKIDQLQIGVWKHYSVDLTSYVNRAWKLREGDRLESVYIVVETAYGKSQVSLTVDNLWIKRPLELI